MKNTTEVLSPEEMDSLTYGFNNPKKGPVFKSQIKPGMIGAQESIDRFSFPYLNTINQRFANFFNTNLSLLLTSNTEVVPRTITQEKYVDFIERYKNYASINVFTLKPLVGNGFLIIESALVSAIVDNLFGGGKINLEDSESREFTQTELRIIKRLTDQALDAQKKAWDLIRKLDFNLVRSETNSQFARIASPNELVITTSFFVRIGKHCSQMHICIPNKVLEPIHDLLQNHVNPEYTDNNRTYWSKSLKNQIHSTDIDVVTNLATIRSTLRQIQSLKNGDIINFEMPKTVSSMVNGLPIMECTFGQSNGKYALKVKKIIRHNIENNDASSDPI